jgi:hypothetical protein
MVILFVLVLAGCFYVLLMHVLRSRVPHSREALGQVRLLHAVASEPERTLGQVERSEVQRVGGPLRAAMDGAGVVDIAGCRFTRTAPGEYRYAGWAAHAVLTVKPLAGGRLLEVGYAVDAKW